MNVTKEQIADAAIEVRKARDAECKLRLLVDAYLDQEQAPRKPVEEARQCMADAARLIGRARYLSDVASGGFGWPAEWDNALEICQMGATFSAFDILALVVP